jgi:hypothetical protein
MKFLLIAKQKKNVDTFETVLGELLARGQEVTLAIQQRDPERDGRLAGRLRHERFALRLRSSVPRATGPSTHVPPSGRRRSCTGARWSGCSASSARR